MNAASSLLQFVVLCHEEIPEPHYDLMFEHSPGGKLATWRSPNWPPLPTDHLSRIADHRREYLEYEGLLSGERGRVRRILRGTYTRQEMASEWIITIPNAKFSPWRLPLYYTHQA